jgi:hypothetical protein
MKPKRKNLLRWLLARQRRLRFAEPLTLQRAARIRELRQQIIAEYSRITQ